MGKAKCFKIMCAFQDKVGREALEHIYEAIAWPHRDVKFLFFERWRNIFHRFRNFVSPSYHVMFCLLYKYQLYKYHSEIGTTAKGTNRCVMITTVIFSHVKRYILLDVLLCRIAENFYSLFVQTTRKNSQ